MWAALPEGCERIVGPAGGAAPGDGPTLVVFAGPDARLAAEAAALGPGSVLAVTAVAPGNADAGRVRLARRALDPRPSLAARRAAGTLAAAGLETWWLDRKEPNRRHDLVRRAGRPAVRPGRQPVVLAARGARPPAALDRALDAAGVTERPRRLRVLASGIVMAEVAVHGVPAVVRVAGGAAGDAAQRAAARQRELRAAGGGVGARIPEPLGAGREGPLAWTLEERRPGAVPTGLTPALLDDCRGFLAALWDVPARTAEPWTAARETAALEPVLASRHRATLERIARALEERLAAVGRGWMHGDFHVGNLLTPDGRLGTVLDWDGAEPGGLPVLDLLHLLALSDPDSRRLPHGARAARLRRRISGDPRVGALVPDLDARVLEALAVAYWLTRAARDLRGFADRAERPAWLEANVRAPLDELEAAGW